MPTTAEPAPQGHEFYDVLPNAQESHAASYAVTNESLTTIRNLIRGKRIRTAAGIASSGEVGLFCLLPSVRDSLVLVDHSRESLETAVLRWRLLYECSIAETLRQVSDYDCHYRNIAKFGLPNVRQPGCRGRVWDQVSRKTKIRRKLDKVKFYLGSIRDLPDTYDFIYLSNAHQPFNGNSMYLQGPPTHEEMGAKLNPGGWLLTAEDYTHPPGTLRYSHPKRRRKYSGLTLQETVSCGYGHRDYNGGCDWDYCLYQKYVDA